VAALRAETLEFTGRDDNEFMVEDNQEFDKHEIAASRRSTMCRPRGPEKPGKPREIRVFRSISLFPLLKDLV
jgi:hypothetical protein